ARVGPARPADRGRQVNPRRHAGAPMALHNTIAPDQARQHLAVWLNDSLPGASDVTIPALEIPSASGFSCEAVLFDAVWTQDGAQQRQSFVARVAPVDGGGL